MDKVKFFQVMLFTFMFCFMFFARMHYAAGTWGGYETRYPINVTFTETGIYPVPIPNTNSSYWFLADDTNEQYYIYCPQSDCSGAVIKNSTNDRVPYYNATSLVGYDTDSIWAEQPFTLIFHFNELNNDIPEITGNDDFISPIGNNITYNGTIDGALMGRGNLTGAGENTCHDIAGTGLTYGSGERTTIALYYGYSNVEYPTFLNVGSNTDDTAWQLKSDFINLNAEIGFYGVTKDFNSAVPVSLNNWEVISGKWNGVGVTAQLCVTNSTYNGCETKGKSAINTQDGYYDSSICLYDTTYLDELFHIDDDVTDAWEKEFSYHLLGNNITISSAETGNLTITNPLEYSIHNTESVNLTWTNNTPYTSVFYSTNGAANVSVTGNVEITTGLAVGSNTIEMYMLGQDGVTYYDSVTFTMGSLLVDCSDPDAVETVKFYFKEEVAKTSLNADAEYSIELATADFDANFSGAVTGANNLTLCTLSGTYNVDMILQYEADGYGTRYYLFDNAEIGGGELEEIDLFLYNETDGEEITVNIQSYIGTPLPDIYVSFQRYYISEDLYRTVAMMKSDDQGEGVVFLESDNVWYRYVLTEDGTTLRVLGPAIITSDEIYLSTSAGDVLTWTDYNTGIQSGCTYNDATEYLSCTFSDPSGLSNAFCLDVDVYNVLTLEDFALSCVETASGTILINMSGAESYNSTAVYSLLASITNDEYSGNITLAREDINFNPTPVYGTLGVFITILIFCVAAGLGFYNPSAAIGLGTFGLVCAVVLTFFTVELIAFGGLIMVSIIIIYKVRT